MALFGTGLWSRDHLQVILLGLLTSMRGTSLNVCRLLLKELMQRWQDRWLLPLQMEDNLQVVAYCRKETADVLQAQHTG